MGKNTSTIYRELRRKPEGRSGLYKAELAQRKCESMHIEKKERFGDLEIDLVIGANHKGALLTINDSATGVLKMKHIESKESKVVEQNAIELLEEWTPFIHTITSDNGKELVNYKEIAEQLNIDFFFVKPSHS